MIESILYVVLAIVGLGFLIFIHELGHLVIAQRQGMRVEIFSIGFGRPMYTWMCRGVKWQICMLPFGGYVKIAGMQREGGVDPSQIPDGYYGKTPWQRIKVAFAGPLVNIVFAVALFMGLWIFGGREKPFSEFTHYIGWVDPNSALYEQGVRPGDVITRYDGRSFQGFKDLLLSSIMGNEQLRIEGYKVNYATQEKTPFDYTLTTYEDPRDIKSHMKTIGVMAPAQYLIFDQKGKEQAGIEPKDRLIWADGELVFSLKQLSSLVNDSTAFLTVQRNGRVFHSKVPRVLLNDLRLSTVEKAEIGDWQHEAALKGSLESFYFIPYNLSPTNEVEGKFPFLDELDQKEATAGCLRCAYFHPLQEGDQILAVDGVRVNNPYQLLQQIQTRRVLLIVDHNPELIQSVLWSKADGQFDAFNQENLQKIVASIGTMHPIDASGHLRLLTPIEPKLLMEMPLSPEQKEMLIAQQAKSKKEIEALPDSPKKQELLKAFELEQKRLALGLPFSDRQVQYNPDPFVQLGQVLSEAWRTLSNLLTGGLSPKYLSGPVGIVHAVHNSWAVGVTEAVFWMAVVSLNLGIMNLLPIPMLDGGHIVFALYEMVTRRRLSAKTMERLIFPFVICLIGFFVFITFHDLTRLFSKFF